jgi:peptidoglycan/LPS O-acetylase OafA/YrhL
VLIVILTIILSVISFRLFEKRLVKVGNNILNRNNKKWK